MVGAPAEMVMISLGWWLAPVAFTAVAFALAWWKMPAPSPRGGDYNFGIFYDVLMWAVLYGAAAIASLIAWLVWALT